MNLYTYLARVVNVVDGDTIDVLVDLGFKTSKEIRLRLADIDTPEIFRPSCSAEREHGLIAKAYVEAAVLDQTVLIETDKDRTGKYGRYVARIITEDGNDLIADMKAKHMEKLPEYPQDD